MALPAGIMVEMEQEEISYTTMYPYERDPDWRFTDQAGHEHDAKLKTCVWYVTLRYYCEDCRDEHEEGEWRCLQCGQVILPGRRYIGHGPHVLPGLRSGRLIKAGSIWRLMAEEIAAMPGVLYADDPPAWDAWLTRVCSRPPDEQRLLYGVV